MKKPTVVVNFYNVELYIVGVKVHPCDETTLALNINKDTINCNLNKFPTEKQNGII